MVFGALLGGLRVGDHGFRCPIRRSEGLGPWFPVPHLIACGRFEQ